MESTDYHGASYIAAYLGTSLTSIHNWRNDEKADFPAPPISITGVGGERAAYGWHKEQLPELRVWFARRMGLDETTAAERWKVIDSAPLTLRKKKVPQASQHHQLLLSIPVQRTKVA